MRREKQIFNNGDDITVIIRNRGMMDIEDFLIRVITDEEIYENSSNGGNIVPGGLKLYTFTHGLGMNLKEVTISPLIIQDSQLSECTNLGLSINPSIIKEGEIDKGGEDFICEGSNVFYGADIYDTVQIGNQCWFARNLNIESQTGTSWCYEGDTSNCDIYGRLYDWEAAMDGSDVEGAQGLCPEGWYIPTKNDFTILSTNVGAPVGVKLKATTENVPSWDGTDNYNFTALPGGYYDGANFKNQGIGTGWWSSTQDGDCARMGYILSGPTSSLVDGALVKGGGMQVRCIRDI